MSVLSIRRVCCLLSALFLPWCLGAEVWVRGSLGIGAFEGEIDVERLGGDTVPLEPESADVAYFPGAIRVNAAFGADGYVRASNAFMMYFEGPCAWGVERFEQLMPDSGRLDASGQSRMILNVREGKFVADGRQLPEVSQLIIETPVGRLSSDGAWWLIDLVYEPQSRIYNFTLECADGTLRFTDMAGDSYVLRGGQRLAGAGHPETLSIEVSEASRESIEFFERCDAAAAVFTPELVSEERLVEHMRALAGLSAESQAARVDAGADRSGARPIVIEYVPRPEPLTPFRGVLKPLPNLTGDEF